MQRISARQWASVCLLLSTALVATGCASKFRVAREPGSRDDKLLVTCNGAPQRFTVREKGTIVPVGELELACVDKTGSCAPKGKGPLEVEPGAWVEVRVGGEFTAGTSHGALCFKSGSEGSCSSDDRSILDVAIDCSEQDSGLLYVGADGRWHPVRDSIQVANQATSVEVLALKNITLQVLRESGAEAPVKLEAGKSQQFALTGSTTEMYMGPSSRPNRIPIRKTPPAPPGQ